MKSISVLLSLVLLSVTSFGQKKKDTVSLNTALRLIEASYNDAAAGFDTNQIKIKSASVEFSTASSQTNDGTIKFFVKIGRKRKNEKESTVTFNFERPKPKKKDSPQEVAFSRPDRLASLILIAVNEYLQAQPPFQLKGKDLEIEFSFTITRTTTAGGEFEFPSITISGGREWERKVSHKLKLTLEAPDGRKAETTAGNSSK